MLTIIILGLFWIPFFTYVVREEKKLRKRDHVITMKKSDFVGKVQHYFHQ